MLKPTRMICQNSLNYISRELLSVTSAIFGHHLGATRRALAMPHPLHWGTALSRQPGLEEDPDIPLEALCSQSGLGRRWRARHLRRRTAQLGRQAGLPGALFFIFLRSLRRLSKTVSSNISEIDVLYSRRGRPARFRWWNPQISKGWDLAYFFFSLRT